MPGMPVGLRDEIENLAAGKKQLLTTASVLSSIYREAKGSGEQIITLGAEALAYACARMPATYAAVERALSLTLPSVRQLPKSLLDCGAGTGAVTLAARSCLPGMRTVCVERSKPMYELGQKIFRMAGVSAEWQLGNAERDPLPEADMVCEGYMLSELRPEQRVPMAQRLWKAARVMLLLVEPGTPQSFAMFREIRKALLEEGAFLAAPCPGMECPLPEKNWCHFTVRLDRSRLMKRLKSGDAPFEDEKFCFLAFTKDKPIPCRERVLRHPAIAKARIELETCTAETCGTKTVRRGDSLWRWARKARCGDAVPQPSLNNPE